MSFETVSRTVIPLRGPITDSPPPELFEAIEAIQRRLSSEGFVPSLPELGLVDAATAIHAAGNPGPQVKPGETQIRGATARGERRTRDAISRRLGKEGQVKSIMARFRVPVGASPARAPRGSLAGLAPGARNELRRRRL